MTLKLSPKQRKDIFHLPIEQAILVPSTKQANKPVSNPEFNRRVAEVRKYLSKEFGGYTSVKGVGGYYSDDKKRLIKEKIAKVTGFSQKKDWNQKKILAQLSKWSKKWGQESMGYEHEGDLYYVPKNLK